MIAKELIKLLKDCPQDLPIIFEDKWIEGVEVSKTGESGYEICGEIRLIKEKKWAKKQKDLQR